MSSEIPERIYSNIKPHRVWVADSRGRVGGSSVPIALFLKKKTCLDLPDMVKPAVFRGKTSCDVKIIST
jgi:hypothetical protein